LLFPAFASEFLPAPSAFQRRIYRAFAGTQQAQALLHFEHAVTEFAQMTQFLSLDRQMVADDKTLNGAMKKILIIDDEEWLREMMQLALRQKGFEVAEAENGEKGIELARKNLPDLILCDVNMEKVDGYHTLSSLRTEPSTASIPFILMTGLADQAGMRHGMELGADDYLPKPFTIEALYAAVDARLKKVNVVRQEAERKLADLRENISMMLPHELRTPLNGILAYGEILTSDAATLPPEEIAEMGQVIYQSGKRLEHLVENFLIFAQLELMGSDPQKLNSLLRKQTRSPGTLVEKQARDQAHLAGRSEDLDLDVSDVAVPMSEEYLGKIVGELVQNAFKFSQARTPVSVTLANSPDGVTLAVADRGHGLSTEHVTKIGAYMQFDRKLHEQQGLGLGLTICKRLTELHGGTLTIQSDLGAGTTVTVKLPKAG
jgi:two-component system, sensor histidine kinase and response regulator